MAEAYSTAAGNARADIARLQSRLNDLNVCLEAASRLLHDPNNSGLAASRSLVDSLNSCKTELAGIQARLDPGSARKAMRCIGLRALKWPFESKEIAVIVSSLEHYKQTITLCLQVDQTTILVDMSQRLENMLLQQVETKGARTSCFNVPFDRDDDFVARPDMTAWLKEKHDSSIARIALVGMGGFGKSQIAIEFAYSIHDELPQSNIFWVHASSKPRFEESYRSIAERMKLPKRDDPGADILALVRDWLQTDDSGSWMIILDNADDVNLFYPKGSNERPLASFLPKRRNNTTLITSRSFDVAERLTGSRKNILQVSNMTEAQGLELLNNKLLGSFNQDTATDFLRALDHIPLAISQAAAYINRRAPLVSIETYLKTFNEGDENKRNLLNTDLGDLRRDDTVSNSVITTWRITFDQIRREKLSAANLLSFMSFFNPHGIPMFALYNYNGYLEQGESNDTQAEGFEDDIDVLRSYSLISVSSTEDTFEMHATVRTCTRAWISASNGQARWKQLFLWTMTDNFRCNDVEDWARCHMLLPHLESITKDYPSEEDIERWTCFLSHLGKYMIEIGKYKEAEDFSKQAVTATSSHLGEKRQEKLKEAELVLLQLLDKEKEVHGEEYPETLDTMHNLALTYAQQNRNGEAEELLVQVVKTEEARQGGRNPKTLASRGVLLQIYTQQCRFQEAENLGVQLIEAQNIALGPEHPDTLSIIHNLAFLNWEQGRFKQANELLTKVFDIRKRISGEQHPMALVTLEVRARVLKDMGHHENALELMRYCAGRFLEVLGPDHPYTMDAESVLAEWEETSLIRTRAEQNPRFLPKGRGGLLK
ncbi:kinesin light chain [Fusarium beomiforme]|uniref:Kinesin light chain n=1 Tax=Fusarium beomiforme TaxID=44412 RepID=A0A9P5A4S7_9HYPO|nr:kinesin light chain [Fusarium beomiforme]